VIKKECHYYWRLLIFFSFKMQVESKLRSEPNKKALNQVILRSKLIIFSVPSVLSVVENENHDHGRHR